MVKVAVIDYGVGNLYSLSGSLKHIGANAFITRDVKELKSASHIVLPGVGAFGDAMDKLKATNLVPTLLDMVQSGKPLLGICLGMQLLFEKSYEYGEHEGLALIKGEVCPMLPDLQGGNFNLKVPHMGWNKLNIKNANCPIIKNTAEGDSVYFVHSFYAKGCEQSLVASAEYGVHVPAIVAQNNVYGCQFHPEKSAEKGLAILKAFLTV